MLQLLLLKCQKKNKLKNLQIMKKALVLLSLTFLVAACSTKPTCSIKNTEKSNDGNNIITLKGKVRFDDPKFKMQIIQRNGFDKKVLGEFDINTDGTYEYKFEVENPGVYTLDCKKWQTVQFWAEDENLEIDFRGYDTAKVKIKNPPYVYIKGGPLNEVMNLMNHDIHRGYQLLIGVSQGVYRAKSLSNEDNGTLLSSMYDILDVESKARARYIAENYANRNSVLAVLPMLKDAELIDDVLAKLESINPNYAPLVKYKEAVTEARYQKNRLAIGQPAPNFTFPNEEGKMVSLSEFKGKLLVIDFWASWCGPCRTEISHIKDVYAKYKNKGVNVLSVSIDKKDADWKKAIKEEQMPWTQLCAPGAGKDIMKEYQFSGIPYIILLDADGKILAKGLSGKDIDKAINAALNKNQ